jgi:hypothetical protein
MLVLIVDAFLFTLLEYFILTTSYSSVFEQSVFEQNFSAYSPDRLRLWPL